MDEIFKATFDDAELMKKLDDLEKQVISIGKSVDAVGDTATESLNAAAGAADNFTASIDKAATDTAKQAKAVQQAQDANRGWLASIRETIAGQQVGGRTLGEWSEQFRNFAARIGQGTTATGGLSRAWQVFNTVLKASGIGLIITAIAALIQYFSKFQPLLDKISQLTAGFSAALNVVAERVIQLGKAFGQLFSGDFSGALSTATDAVSDFGGAIADAAIQAANLEKRLQELRDVTITQSVEAARARVELQKFKEIADDGTRSINERAKAARAASEIEKQLADQAVDRALEAQQIAQQKFALDKENLTAREEAAKAEVDFQNAVIERNSVIFEAEQKQREFRKEAFEERKKQQEDARKQLEAFQKLLEEVGKRADALDIENTFNPIQRVEKEFAAALDGVEELQKRLISLATSPEQRAQIEAEISRLFGEIVAKYNEELSKAKQEVEEINKGKSLIDPLPQSDALVDDLAFRAKGIIKQLQTAAQGAIEENRPKSLAEILGISDEGLEGLKDATEKVLESLAEIAEAQLKHAEERTRQRERDLQEAQEFLIRQQELAAEGLANDTDLAKQQVEKQKELRDAALKEEAKARRTAILLDAAQQVSSLITSSANIFKSLSALGPFGIGLAVATIATMFGAFAKAKAEALKAAAIPKLRKGGKIEGRTHEAGGELARSDSGDFYELENGEWVIGTKPSREHDRFFERVNDGETAGYDLDAMFNRYKSDNYRNPITEAAPRIERIEKQHREIRETQHTQALADAYREAAREIVVAIQEKEVVTPLADYKVIKKRGPNTDITIVRAEK